MVVSKIQGNKEHKASTAQAKSRPNNSLPLAVFLKVSESTQYWTMLVCFPCGILRQLLQSNLDISRIESSRWCLCSSRWTEPFMLKVVLPHRPSLIHVQFVHKNWDLDFCHELGSNIPIRFVVRNMIPSMSSSFLGNWDNCLSSHIFDHFASNTTSASSKSRRARHSCRVRRDYPVSLRVALAST